MKQTLTSSTHPSYSVCSLPAQDVDAIITHFSQGVMAGEEWLPSGNYTITTMHASNGSPLQTLLRFQSEDGVTRAVFAVREAHTHDAQTQVQLAADGVVLRVSRVIINGAVFSFTLPYRVC